MKIKSLLLTLALLFTAQNYCADTDSKTKEETFLTLEIAFKTETKKMSQEHIAHLIDTHNTIFLRTVEPEYRGRWIKFCITNYKEYTNELKELGLTECMFMPSYFFQAFQYFSGLVFKTRSEICINFILVDTPMLQAKKSI